MSTFSLDSEKSEYPAALVKIYLDAGLKTRAQGLYNTAVGRFPADPALAALASHFEEESGGGLLGFLNKKKA